MPNRFIKVNYNMGGESRKNLKNYIIHLGASGFPSNNAQMQRIKLIFRSLSISNCKPLIINKYSLSKDKRIKTVCRVQDILYINTSSIKYRPDNLILRNINKVSGIIGEFILLFKLRKKTHTAIYYDSSFAYLVYYRLLSFVFNFKLILQYVELKSASDSRRKLSNKINDKIFDNYCFYFCDGMLVISEFLRNRALEKRRSLPLLKVPAICDFEEFSRYSHNSNDKYIMFCGAVGYFSIIKFIIDLYTSLQDMELYDGELVLAIGVGDKESDNILKLHNYLNLCKYKKRIHLRTNVPRNELISMYHLAAFLIVPIRNHNSDLAGFHHKVGEYSAAGKPIISTNLGELNYYFEDGTSAILADQYSITSYIERLRSIISNEQKCMEIGQEGKKVGIKELNYKSYSYPLKHFIYKII